MCVLPTYKYVHHMHTWCPWRSEENVGSPGTIVTDSYEPPYSHWELKSGPLQEQEVL